MYFLKYIMETYDTEMVQHKDGVYNTTEEVE